MLRVVNSLIFLSLLYGGVVSGSDLAIRKNLEVLFPEQKISSVKSSVLPDLYEVTVSSSVFYVSSDARYLFHGELIDTKNKIKW